MRPARHARTHGRGGAGARAGTKGFVVALIRCATGRWTRGDASGAAEWRPRTSSTSRPAFAGSTWISSRAPAPPRQGRGTASPGTPWPAHQLLLPPRAAPRRKRADPRSARGSPRLGQGVSPAGSHQRHGGSDSRRRPALRSDGPPSRGVRFDDGQPHPGRRVERAASRGAPTADREPSLARRAGDAVPQVLIAPALVALVIGSVVVFLLLYLVPRLATFIETWGTSCPRTRVLSSRCRSSFRTGGSSSLWPGSPGPSSRWRRD